MQQMSALLDDGVVYMVILGVCVMTLMTMFVYVEGRQDGRIDVSSGQWQCEKFVDIRQVIWECEKNEN